MDTVDPDALDRADMKRLANGHAGDSLAEVLPTAEAAAVLHTTPKAVESRLYRARQRLREQLARQL